MIIFREKKNITMGHNLKLIHFYCYFNQKHYF